MEEKIKIYIPESVNAILLKDIERFEFYKKDGSLNKNEFYNTLIINYYEQYENSQSNIYSHIKKTIKDRSDLSDFDISDIASEILKYIDTNTYQLDRQKYDVSISFKPTKKSSNDIEYIQNCLLSNSTLSNYFRNMFASYVLLPQDKREKIIFKKNFEIIDEALNSHRKIYFTTINSSKTHIVSPVNIANSKEELFNYLLCIKDNLPYSYRISRIKQIKILNEDVDRHAEYDYIFDNMIKYGPQFAYEVNKEIKRIKVKFTDRGKEMYKRIYLHRPAVTEIDGNIYYFDCSRNQAYQYFARFGSNALVLEPQDLREDLYKFYFHASNKYSSKK